MRLRVPLTLIAALALSGCGLVGSTPIAAPAPAIRIVYVAPPHRDAVRAQSAASVARTVAAGYADTTPMQAPPTPVATVTAPTTDFPTTTDPLRAATPPVRGGDGRWINGFELTEYYPALESWATGAAIRAPGLSGAHRIDWLYSAHGLSMEGEGIGLDGRWYHIAGLGTGGWVTVSGGPGARFGAGPDTPYWRTGGFFRNAAGGLTFPLANGGWSNGTGRRWVTPPAGIWFAPGQSRPLDYLRSVAVDPRVIPLGSHIYIPAYAQVNGGWFQADDTGGAIMGRHLDIFRPPPASPSDLGNLLTDQPVYVVAPGRPLP